jgi:glycosyltransferase involved in cell wall biosynthesis
LANKIRLLFISSLHLFPGTRFGGSKRLYYLARAWEHSADLSLICMDGSREWSESMSGSKAFKDFLFVPGFQVPGVLERLTRPTVDRRTFLEPHRREIADFLRGKRFDAIVLAYPWSLSYLRGHLDTAGIPVAYMEDDLVFEQFRKASLASYHPVKRFWKWFRYRQTLGFYRPLMSRIASFIGISRQEGEVMRSHFPGLDVRVVQYGIPMDEYPILPPPRSTRTLGFIGNYGHPPNEDALLWLADSLAPAIRARSSGVRFILAGKGLPAWARERFGADGSVELREDVEALRDFYSDIDIFINPIRTGRGMRTKLIEAAAFGRPIITTALGAEGLECFEMSMAEDDAAMAEAAALLWDDPGSADRVARNRKVAEARFSLETVAADFLSMLLEKKA